MARTWIRQHTQIRNTDPVGNYDDTVSAGSTMESGVTTLEGDLNCLRSQIKRLGGETNWYDALSGRDLATMDTDLTDMEDKRLLCGVQVLTNISVPASAAATGSLDSTGNLQDGDSFTFDAKTYVVQSTLTDADGNIQLGGTQAATMENIRRAVNLDGTAGTHYANSMTLHPTLSATDTATSVDLTAKTKGTAGNAITLAEVTDAGGNFTVDATLSGGAGDVVVLSQASSETPTDTAAIGTGLGAVVAVLSGDVGSADLAEIAGSNALTPKNIVVIRDATTKDPINSTDGYEIFGLLQAESGVVQDDAFNDSDHQVQISFVHNDGSDDLEIVDADDIGGSTIEYTYPKRVSLDTLPEDCSWPPGNFSDQTSAVDVTLDRAIDNQGTTPATQIQNIDIDMAASVMWAWRDVNDADLLSIYEDSSGSTTEVAIGSAVDLFDVDAADVDFLQGIAVDSGGTEITIGETAGQIDSAGALTLATAASGDLTLNSDNEIAFVDTNKGGSTYSGTFKLAETSAEWDTFESNFGEVSLLNALNQAYTGIVRTKTYANVTSTTSADTDIGGAGGGANLDAQLPDMSAGTFLTDYDVYWNGELLRPGADAAANNDYYPGTSLANGQIKLEFQAVINDVVCVIAWA